MQRMDSATEKRIMTALESAISMTNAGSAPNDAIYKVASENQFGAPVIRRMVEAFNVSKTLAHMKTAAADKRAESFPIADASAILERLYPSTYTSKSAEVDYSALPTKEKNFVTRKLAAELFPSTKPTPYPRDPSYEVGRWFAKRDHLKRAMEQERLAVSEAYTKMAEALDRASNYFRRPGHEAFESIEKRAQWEYGKVGKAVMDLVYHGACLSEKRAEAPSRPLIFDRSKEPYSSIAASISYARRVEEKSAAYARLEHELNKHGESYPRALPVAASAVLDSLVAPAVEVPQIPFAFSSPGAIDKSALDLTSLLAGKTVADLMGNITGAPDSEGAKAKAMAKIYDPQHEATLSTAKVKAMLNDFMSNDEVLSTYPQESVIDSYNQLAKLAPMASQQPSVMRGVLRKMIQQGGVVEPFEVNQLENIESGLRKLSPGASMKDGE